MLNNTDNTTLKTIKNARLLGKYTDGELLAATSGEAPPAGTTEWIERILKAVKTVESSATANKQKLPSAKETYERILKDINDRLTAYENGPKVQNYEGTLTDNTNLNQMTFDQAMVYRNNLLAYQDNAELVSLLAKKELGRLYCFFKMCVENRYEGWNWYPWDEFCTKYLGSRRQVNRYIDVYSMLYYYPRLAVCKLSMETILRFKEMLLETLKNDYNLAARLGEPLYTTSIKISVNINESEAIIPTGSIQLLSEKNKMQGGWQTEDAIMDCK